MPANISFASTKTECGRMATYVNWQGSLPAPLILSQCGFYSTQNVDEVQCCDCLVKIKHWTNKDHPLIEHYKSNKRCLYVQKYRYLFDNIGRKLVDRSSVTEKQNTFKGHSLKQNVQSLTNAGFCMSDEKCKCFYCDVEIKNWYVCDIPILEHYIKSPNCFYIQPFIIKVICANDLRTSSNIGQHNNVSNESSGKIVRPIQEVESTPSTKHVIVQKTNSDTPAMKDPYKNINQTFYKCNGLPSTNKEVLHFINKDDFSKSRKDTNLYSKVNHSLQITESQSNPDLAVCKICLDNEVRITFQPCGHLATCTVCSKQVDNCPICRSKIEGTVTSILA